MSTNTNETESESAIVHERQAQGAQEEVMTAEEITQLANASGVPEKSIADFMARSTFTDAEFDAAIVRAKARVLDGVEDGWFRDVLIQIMDG